MTILALRGSSDATGSSASTISGSCTSARQIATRCCWPPDSWSARRAASVGDVELVAARPSQWRGPRGGQSLQRGAPGRRVGQPAHQHVVQHVQPADQVELLEDHGAAAAPVAQACGRRAPVTSAPCQVMRPGGRLGQPVDHAQQGRFAGAGAADHADELPGRDRQANVVHGARVTIGLRQAFQHQHRRPCGRRRQWHLWQRQSARVGEASMNARVRQARLDRHVAQGMRATPI